MDTQGSKWAGVACRTLWTLALVAAACRPAWAQADFASVSTRANTHGLNNQGPFIDVPGAATSLARGQTTEDTGTVMARASNGGVTSTVTVSARATAPVSLGQLAEIGASARIDAIRSGPAAAPGYQWTDASAAASFVDDIRLNPLATPNQMVLSFALTGGFHQVVPLQFYPVNSPASAQVQVTFYAATGSYFQGPNGVGFGVYSEGSTNERTQFIDGVARSAGLFNTASNPAAYTATEAAPGLYQITLGPAYFANPNATDLRLSLTLGASASLYAFAGFATDTMTAEADYAHTLQMTGLQALDAQGNDITQEAVLSFASTQAAAVPEPGALALMLMGLGVLVAARSGRPVRREPLARFAR